MSEMICQCLRVTPCEFQDSLLVDPAPVVGASTSMDDVLAAKDARIKELEAHITHLVLNQASVMDRNVGFRLMSNEANRKAAVLMSKLAIEAQTRKDAEAENAALSRMVDVLCFELTSRTNELTEGQWREWAEKQANQGTN